MKSRKNLLVVDNLTMKELLGLSDKAISVRRKKIRLQFGLSKQDMITTYHLAEFMHTPLEYIESHIN